MALVEKLEFLKQLEKEKPGGILSIYLDTDRSKTEQQQGQWKVRLKNGLKRLEEYLQLQGADTERQRLRKVAGRVKKEVANLQRHHQKGLVFFVSDDFKLWEVAILQVEVTNEFHWDTKPSLQQLEKIEASYPSSGIILAHTDQIRVVDTLLGEVVEEINYCWNVSTEDWSPYTGPASPSAPHTPSSTTQKDQFEKRKEVYSQREYKKLTHKLRLEAKKRGWKQIHLVGDTPFVQSLHGAFDHISVVKIIPKNLKIDSPYQIIHRVM